MKSKVLQLRLDKDLAHSLAAHVEAAHEANAKVNTSVVARMLLREALAARQGRVLPVDAQGFLEGYARGYGEAQAAVHSALHSASQARRSS